MYSPELNENLIATLYRVKRFYRKPITKIAEELILKGLKTINKDLVCKLCISERNNDCKNCFIAKKTGKLNWK